MDTDTGSPLTLTPSSSLRILASLLRLPPEMTARRDDTSELPPKWLAQQKQVVDSGPLPPGLTSQWQNQHQHQHQHQHHPLLFSPRWNLGNSLVRRVVIDTIGPVFVSASAGHNREGDGGGLCDAHRGLNKELVGEVYYLVRKEVLAHGEGVRSWLRHISRHEDEYKDQEWGDVRENVELMVGIVTLMEEFTVGDGRSEERWERYFGRGVEMENKGKYFERVKTGCMACVLGVIGGRKELIIGLKGSCLARARRRTPRLLGRWLPGWVLAFGNQEQKEIEKKSEELAGRIRVVRGLQKERFRRGRKGEWVNPRLVREVGGAEGVPTAVPTCYDHGEEEHHEEDQLNDVNDRLSTNNPYHQSANNNKGPSPHIPEQPFGGFDGPFDDDAYPNILDGLIPDHHHIRAPYPIPPPSPLSDNETDERGFIPPRQSWTAYPPPLFSPRYHPLHRPINPGPQAQYDCLSRPKALVITPPPSSSESYYADEIYDHYTGDVDEKRAGLGARIGTKASTVFSGRPKPEEYDGLVSLGKEALLSPRYPPSCRQQQQKTRVDDYNSEKTMQSRLKKRLQGSPRSSGMSDSARTEWVDFF
ncbi:hypothetical protein B0T21DRAFT_410581 [Apiosordaria backusii]|uniref:Uncharacterized protein n=1 Tax=Apiosordaria backusii TaxID=314023 RepID=A0AA40EI59_9PEZI|nr:hypothetical protein B0T21DRAFT_410581 [Apiosordaria backusii]